MSALLAALFVAHVAIADLDKPMVSVELQLDGQQDGPVKLCFERRAAARYLRGLPPDPSDDTCFLATAKAGKLTARYQLDLDGLADATGDPDDATRAPGGFVVSDRSLLALPEHADAELVIDLSLPAGASAAAPWKREGKTGARFRTTARQVRCGSYLALGKFRPLAELEASGSSLQIMVFGKPGAATDAGLRRWLEAPFAASAGFWRHLPKGILAVLVPSDRSDEAGIFGSVLHEEMPSAVLWFGAAAHDAEFTGHWLAFHELFHLGQPAVSPRLPWFSEGTATYYEHVLRARSGARPAAEMWGDLKEQFRELCGADGTSLSEESKSLRRTHRYRSLYWRGACAAFQIDVAIRVASGGRRSLDDSMRELAALSQTEVIDESLLLAKLDEASGGLATKAVRGQMPPVEGPIKQVDEKLRDAIFAPR